MIFKFSMPIFLLIIIVGTKCINSSQSNINNLELIDGCDSMTSRNQQTHCQIKELKKSHAIKTILGIVGDDPRPKVNHISNQPLLRIMKSAVEQKTQEIPCNWPKCYPTLVKAIFMKHTNPPPDFPSTKDRLWFNVDSLNGFTLEKATVTFFTGRLRDDFGDTPLFIRLFKYQSKGEDYEEYLTATIEKDPDDFLDDNWQTIDITEVVKRWVLKQSENYGIRIEVIPIIKGKIRKELAEIVGDKTPSAFIEITNAEKKIVDRRNLEPHTREITDRCTVLDGSKNETCCRYPFEIKFEDYGWDWIIAPKTLTLYYCAGTCTRGKQEGSPHTELLKLSNHGTNCCSPDDAGPVNIMYVDREGNYQVKAIPGLLVAHCRCR